MFKVHSGLDGKYYYETHQYVQWTYTNKKREKRKATGGIQSANRANYPGGALTRRGILELCKVPEVVRMLRQKSMYWGEVVWNAWLRDLPTITDYAAMKESQNTTDWKLVQGFSFSVSSFSFQLLLFLLPEFLPLVGMQPVIKLSLHTIKQIVESLVGLFWSKRLAIFFRQ